MSTITRIKQLSDNEGIGLTLLEQKIGASKGVLSRAHNQNTDIQSKWLTKIVENYPQYDCEWLLTGKGQMLKIKTYQGDNSFNAVAEPYGKCPFCEDKERLIKSLEKTIEILEFNLGKNQKNGLG